MTKLDPSKEAIIFDCYVDRKVTLWMRDKYRIVAETKEQAIDRLKELANNPVYEEPEFRETDVLFDTEEELTTDDELGMSPVKVIIFHDPITGKREEVEL